MLLSHLPPEILDYILTPSGAVLSVLQLWLTGDKILRSRLAKGLKRLDLTPISNKSFRLPPMVSDLRVLRHFALPAKAKTMEDRFKLESTLKTLSGTLESLELPFSNAREDVFINCDLETATSPPPTIKTQYPRGLSRCIDIGAMLPKLLSLKIYGYRAKPLRDFVELFPALPSTLTDLYLHHVSRVSYPFASLLPKSLLRLDCNFALANTLDPNDPLFLEDWANAPPHMQYIRGIRSISFHDQLEWLPNSITQLDSCFLWMSPQLPPRFPSGVIGDLSIRLVDSTLWGTTWIANLPRNLTKLAIYGASPRFGPMEVSLLPVTLTFLECPLNFKSWPTGSSDDGDAAGDAKSPERNCSGVWPPNLIEAEFSASPLSISMLPHSLKKLSLQLDEAEEGTLKVNDLPPLLSALSLDGPTALSGNWPTSLTKLEINNNDNITDCPSFPPSLTHFAWRPDLSRHGNDVGTEDHPCFATNTVALTGSGLTTLSVIGWNVAWFEFIPRSVASIEIFELHYSTATPEAHFKDLPPGLVHLRIENGYSDLIFGDEIELSPTSLSSLHHLEDLDLRNLICFPSSALRHLPRTLEHLTVRFVLEDASDLRFLPSTLCTIALDRPFNWSLPGIADHWPRDLVRLIPPKHEEIKQQICKRPPSQP